MRIFVLTSTNELRVSDHPTSGWYNLKRGRGFQILVVRCPKSGRGFGKYGRETLPGPGNS